MDININRYFEHDHTHPKAHDLADTPTVAVGLLKYAMPQC